MQLGIRFAHKAFLLASLGDTRSDITIRGKK